VSSKTHPRLVGFFVLGAVALVLGAVVILGSGDLLRRTDRFTVFFPGSVRGLGKGSMVSFRGIKIGEVRSVHGIWTSRPDEPIQIEVELELFQSVVDFARGVPQPDATTPEKLAKALLDLGIRARLASTSPLTGQKYVDLDFAPNDPPRFVGLPSRYPELPTTPSSFEKLGTRAEEMWSRISELPVEKMLDDLGKTLQSLRKALEAPELEGAIGGVHRSADELATTLRETRAAVADLRRVLEIAQGEGTATAAETRQTMAEARRSIARAEKSLETLDAMMRGADTTRLSAEETLAELRQALQAIGGLVDYVQAHPEAVVLGKERAGEKK
jgi:paraquat-inducible protein B